MITSPTVSVLRNSTNPAWESGSSGEKGAVKISRLFLHNPVSAAHPSRQASRLPIKVLKMLTARAGHMLHPEYLQPLPSTPISPIEVRTDAVFWQNVCAHGLQSESVSLPTPQIGCSSYIFSGQIVTSCFTGGKNSPLIRFFRPNIRDFSFFWTAG